MNKQLKKGERCAKIATIATIFLALIKGIVGVLSGSLLLIADAIHSSVDIVAIFAAWIGLKIAQRKPDKKFHYGYYKAENIMAIVVVGFIFFAAYEIFMQSFSKFFKVSDISLPILAVIVPLISAIASYFIAIYEEKVGKKINSQSLIANAQESKADTFSSMIVFFGIAFSVFKIPYVEGIVGILISLFILKIGYQNGKIAVLSLMDASIDPKIEKKLREFILKVKNVLGVRYLKLRQSGPFIFGEVVVLIKKDIDIKKAHDIADVIETDVKKNFKIVESLSIHLEPYTPESQKILIPIKEKKGLNSKTSGHFGRASDFLIAEIENKKLKEWNIQKNPFIKRKEKAGFFASKIAFEKNVDAIIVDSIGEIAFHTLKDGLVDIYLRKGNSAKKIIDNFSQGKLKKLTKATHESDN